MQLTSSAAFSSARRLADASRPKAMTRSTTNCVAHTHTHTHTRTYMRTQYRGMTRTNCDGLQTRGTYTRMRKHTCARARKSVCVCVSAYLSHRQVQVRSCHPILQCCHGFECLTEHMWGERAGTGHLTTTLNTLQTHTHTHTRMILLSSDPLLVCAVRVCASAGLARHASVCVYVCVCVTHMWCGG